MIAHNSRVQSANEKSTGRNANLAWRLLEAPFGLWTDSDFRLMINII